MGDEDVEKLRPPRLFGRRAPKAAAPCEPVAAPEAAPPEVVEATEAAPGAPASRTGGAVETAELTQVSEIAEEPEPARAPRPPLGRQALLGLVTLTGLVSGGVLAALTWAFLQLDDDSHLSFVYVLIVFIAGVVVGWVALQALKVRSPGTVAFLGTGVVAVVAMCVGSGPLETRGGAIGVIVGSALAYPAARWVTTSFVDHA